LPRWSSAVWVKASALEVLHGSTAAVWASQAHTKGWDGPFSSRTKSNPLFHSFSTALSC